MKKSKHGGDLLFAAVILFLVLVILYSGLQIVESTVFRTGQEPADKVSSKTITRDGVDYFPRQDITTVLVLGIDQFGPVADSGAYSNRGAADMDILLIFDETNEVCNVLHLNRDTMLEMPVLGIGGRKAGTYFGQLALAHTYGNGLEDSCENSREAVSDFLYGLRIDYYVSMNMDAIAILNDAVGGVTVNVTQDFSNVDPSIGMGPVTLMGQQAIHYVRTRKGVGDQLNLSRIERHKVYLDAFAEAFRAKREREPEFIMEAYEAVAPYLVTDCSGNAITGMVDRYSDYTIGEVISPEGENVVGQEYMEFYVNEEALDALILRLFYAPK
jgi:LCP family protein required for cell wall assembly